jgi:glutathione S-transferase
VSPPGAAALGLVFILGRALYARGYLSDPGRRGPGFLLTILTNAVLLVGGTVGALLDWL